MLIISYCLCKTWGSILSITSLPRAQHRALSRHACVPSPALRRGANTHSVREAHHTSHQERVKIPAEATEPRFCQTVFWERKERPKDKDILRHKMLKMAPSKRKKNLESYHLNISFVWLEACENLFW